MKREQTSRRRAATFLGVLFVLLASSFLRRSRTPSPPRTSESYTIEHNEADTAGERPQTAEEALAAVAINNTVILSALNFGYRSIMMNWVCNMRKLQITNFIIAALDPNLHMFAAARDVPSFFEDTIDKGIEDEKMGTEGTYGSVQFKRITKMKTRVVARVLRMGYNVVWSDCDIIWFRNPIEYLWAQNVDLVIQSNAPDSEASNNKGRINSGFYLVQKNPRMIVALDKVITHARRSRKSEQPSFYDVLCGSNMEHTISDDRCESHDVTVKLLDRNLFPNGDTRQIWDLPPGMISEQHPSLYILHNNWVVGVNGKEERLRRHGFVMYNSAVDACVVSQV